ncbi:dehydrogenase [Multifurca ochricompacta]|uniref:Dehydrogenase n=1 Tax=Multifurca ochricompacta TaxID=376703 RepID=A0AAD4QR72_9AGAM|nr:dehydrogenase [Multifurca ochricompacta]
MAPTLQKAVVIQRDGSVALREITVPKAGPNEILVKVIAAGQNPTDWKTARYGKRAGTVSGCDFSGIGLRSVGGRVAGLVQGGSSHYGAFSEYLITDADFVVHIPDTWSSEDAAQLGVAPLTALRVLYEILKLPEPLRTPAAQPQIQIQLQIPILISGGATSVGQYAIQFAKFSGLYVIATASQRNFGLVHSLGADLVVDYGDPVAAVKQIRVAAPNLEHAVDCVGEGTSPKIVIASFNGKGTLAQLTLSPYNPVPVEGVKIISSVIFEWIGKDYDFPVPFTASPKLKENGRKWVRVLSELLLKTNLRPNPVMIQPHGLASVEEGFQYMSEGKVSAQKITYRIADTPSE